MKLFLAAVFFIFLIFLTVILIRAIRFIPKQEPVPSGDPVILDEQSIICHMQEMIRCRTVSYEDASLIDQEEFQKFRNLLPSLFPKVHQTCTLHTPGVNGLLYHWKGRSSGDPVVLMAHYDVVPVAESQWEKPAFDAVLEDGILWGRGTLDTKGTLCGILEAAEKLIGDGFVPEHDIYFAFSGQEEINGTTCQSIVDWFEERSIHPAMVLDEGGAVVENVFPGVSRPCAVIGIAEKGMVNLEFRAKSRGGHASTPPVHTIVGELAQAVTDVEKHPFPRQLTKPVREMLDTLGRHSAFPYKIIFANLWCFEGLLDWICRKAGGELNAMMRTTCAVTRMEGSKAFNVLPPAASVGMNLRLIGTDTVESVRAYLEKVIHNPNIEIAVCEGRNPSPDSDTACEEWHRLCQAVADTWTISDPSPDDDVQINNTCDSSAHAAIRPDTLVSPYLMMACSDSWYYSRITDRVYKFSAMKLTSEELAMIHGNNERVPVKTLMKTVEFYVRLIRGC